MVSGYKSRLNTEINIFNRLKENGLSFSENHFKNDYLNKKEFSLPRSLKDWELFVIY